MAIAPIRHIAIIGGTHGNELTGIYLAKKFQQSPDLIARSSLQVTTLLANPKAIELNRRYVDRDLNRCFAQADLLNPALTQYEDQRAKAIAALLCPPHGPHTDLIIDIHSTTANMGTTLLLSNDHPFNLRLAAYLCSLNPDVKVCFRESKGQDAPMLRSLAPFGCTLEVGPVAQGVLDAQLLLTAERIVQGILDYIEAYNCGEPLPISCHLPLYRAFGTLDYPRTKAGDIHGAVHPQLQGKDYAPLNPGDPIFLLLTGESIYYAGEKTVYPVFINEAAYYEKGIAMVLTSRQNLDIST